MCTVRDHGAWEKRLILCSEMPVAIRHHKLTTPQLILATLPDSMSSARFHGMGVHVQAGGQNSMKCNETIAIFNSYLFGGSRDGEVVGNIPALWWLVL